MLPKKFRIVTNKKVFAIQRKDHFFWKWEGGESSIASNYTKESFPKETFDTESLARSYIAREYGKAGMSLIVNDELRWEEV